MPNPPSRTFAIAAVAVLLLAKSAGAQQPPADAAQVQQMQQMMVPMMSQMASVILESTLTALAKPENAERLADFNEALL